MTANTTLTADASYSQINSTQYAINQNLLNVHTILPCKIIAITGNTYTIQSLNYTIAADNTPYTPSIIYNVPYAMEMGGNAGIIIQPKVNDTVLVGFCERDITAIKKGWTLQRPASFRKFSLSDAVIIKCLSNTPPSVYIKITNEGIEIIAPSLPVTVNAENILLGENASNNVLLQGVSMKMDIAGVEPGNGVTGVIATVKSGGSSVVQGAV